MTDIKQRREGLTRALDVLRPIVETPEKWRTYHLDGPTSYATQCATEALRYRLLSATDRPYTSHFWTAYSMSEMEACACENINDRA